MPHVSLRQKQKQDAKKVYNDMYRILNPFVSQTGTTALFFAAQGGFLDIVQLLLENDAPVDSLSVVSVLAPET